MYMQRMMHPGPPWLVLLLSTPRDPSSLRVRAWRRLRALGALALKQGVWLLPNADQPAEQCQWLAQQVQRDGGEATLLRVARVENVSDDDLVRRFQAARDAEYRQVAEGYRKLLRQRERSGRPAGRAGARDEMQRLGRELARIRSVDYFQAPAGEEAHRAKAALEARLAAPHRPAPTPTLPPSRGALWVTRPRPHVDRLASAWLIRRCVDPEARFVFAPPDALPSGAIPFDVAGVALGHHGDHCTFETLLEAIGVTDRRLQALAEIVHEADLEDGRYARPEARGLDVAVRALLAAVPDDAAVLETGLALFQGLYLTLPESSRGEAGTQEERP
jgi:hypothetical protein